MKTCLPPAEPENSVRICIIALMNSAYTFLHCANALAAAFLNVVNSEQSRNVRGFTPKAEHILKEYPWPGNVRELKNVIRRAVLINTGDELDASAFPEEMVAMSKEPAAGGEVNLKDAALHAGYEMIKKVLSEVNN